MALWCYSALLLLLVAGSTSMHVDHYDDFDHDTIISDRDEEPSPTTSPLPVTRTTLTTPLRCFSCSSWDDATCFTPATPKTNVTTCATEDSKCFITTIKRTLGVVVRRGCQDKCVVDHWTTCCEGDLCNSQIVEEVVQLQSARRLDEQKNKSDKPLPQTVLFFVTVLLLLQTVVKRFYPKNT